jgi:hypothetical protein
VQTAGRNRQETGKNRWTVRSKNSKTAGTPERSEPDADRPGMEQNQHGGKET